MPTWDQYANPAQAAPPYSAGAPSPYAQPATQPLFPEGMPEMSTPQNGMFGTIQQQMRFLQEVRLRGAWLAGGTSADDMGVVDADLSATFAVPWVYNQAPFLITPGYSMHFFDGPIAPVTVPPALGPDMPPRTYDAFLDFGWQPQINQWFGVNVGARVGVYSDFSFVDSHSIRIMGRALGVATVTNEVQITFGVVYLDRNRIKLLPAGGVIWTPNPDARYEILFPNPKLARRLTTIGTSDLWYYISGEYGDGSWTITREDGSHDSVDYNDIRVAIGLEEVSPAGGRIFIEGGFVFDRELFYRSNNPPPFDLSNTVMVRGGISY